ncbi:hypothetical protein ABTD92_21925, partial [Acinetobacter baumannii]
IYVFFQRYFICKCFCPASGGAVLIVLFLLDQKKNEKKSRLKIKSYIKPSFAKTKELPRRCGRGQTAFVF